jgi:8-oxo-dGTP pyrophosphatase MutT (NUDIX family)
MTCSHDPAAGHWPVGFSPLYLSDHLEPVGHLPITLVARLRQRGLIVPHGARPVLHHHGDLTGRLEDARDALFKEGFIGPRRDELMPVRATFDGPALAVIDRSALRPLGLWATKVHINGLVPTAENAEPDVWLSLRAAHASAFPGYYDTLAAGGQPHDLTAYETAVKEGWEEAGIDARLMASARHIHDLPVFYVSRQGFHQEVLAIYDLVLPRDWTPTRIDGEIEANLLVPMEALRKARADLKLGSQLVCDDLVARLPRDGNDGVALAERTE